MNRAIDVARYIVNYSNDKNYCISNLKLQKLLYFVQAYFLLSDEVSCFSEDIEAWDFGPVVPEVYHEFKRFGSAEIPPVKTYFEMDGGFDTLKRKEFDESIISSKDRKMIAEVVDGFKGYSSTALVTLTHNQAPWRDAYIPGQSRKITPEAIQRYFANE